MSQYLANSAGKDPIGWTRRGFVSAYSQNEVAGTMQRLPTPSHSRQCGLAMLRMLVTGWPPY
jgi:hypothetical protein